MSTAPDTLDLPLTPPPGGQILHQTARATVIWGDCTDPAVIAQVPDWYGLLCTDPPYGVGYNSGRSSTFTEITGDDGSVDWPAVLGHWVGPEGTFNAGLAPSRHVYVFGYRPDQLAAPLRLGGTAELIWDKVTVGTGDLSRSWGPSHEPITFGVHVKRRSDRAKGAGNLAARLRRGSILRWQRPNCGLGLRHSNEKPWQILADLVESSTVRGDLVVDPCAGSGSTGVAAVLEGRRCFLVEIDHRYAELAVRRVIAGERIAAPSRPPPDPDHTPPARNSQVGRLKGTAAMPITLHDQPSYALDCDRCDAPAEHDDGTPTLFDTEDTARSWARDNGWQVATTTGEQLLCSDCGIDAANEREHAEEIAAAVQYAIGTDGGAA